MQGSVCVAFDALQLRKKGLSGTPVSSTVLLPLTKAYCGGVLVHMKAYLTCPAVYPVF
jgi:hypothetical protein